MKKLKQLIKDKDFAQAKVYILDNRERLEEIADCLLEEIDGRLSVEWMPNPWKFRHKTYLTQRQDAQRKSHNSTISGSTTQPKELAGIIKRGYDYKENDTVEVYSYGKSVEKSEVEHHESKSNDILPNMRDYSNVKACDLTFMLTDLKGNKHKITPCTDSDVYASYIYKENEFDYLKSPCEQIDDDHVNEIGIKELVEFELYKIKGVKSAHCKILPLNVLYISVVGGDLKTISDTIYKLKPAGFLTFGFYNEIHDDGTHINFDYEYD